MARPRKRARAVVARRCGRRSCVRSAARAPMPRPTWARRQAAALALRVERQQRGPWRGRRNTAAAPSCHRRACGRSSARAPRSTRALRTASTVVGAPTSWSRGSGVGSLGSSCRWVGAQWGCRRDGGGEHVAEQRHERRRFRFKTRGVGQSSAPSRTRAPF